MTAILRECLAEAFFLLLLVSLAVFAWSALEAVLDPDPDYRRTMRRLILASIITGAIAGLFWFISIP